MNDPTYPPNLTDRVVTLRALIVARLALGKVEDVARRDQLAAALDGGDFMLEPITDEGEPALLIVVSGQPFCSTPLEPLLLGLVDTEGDDVS